MENKNLIQRLKECEDMPLFRKIIIGETSFIKEITDFYNCEIFLNVYSGRGFLPEKITSDYNSNRFLENYKVWPSVKYKFQEDNISKYGRSPKDLIAILNHTTDISFDTTKLEYDKIKEKRNLKKDEKLKKKITACGAIATTTFFLSSIFNHVEIAIPIEILILGYMLSNPPQPSQNQLEINELNKLIYHAKLADSQMWNYRLELLKERFDN